MAQPTRLATPRPSYRASASAHGFRDPSEPVFRQCCDRLRFVIDVHDKYPSPQPELIKGMTEKKAGKPFIAIFSRWPPTPPQVLAWIWYSALGEPRRGHVRAPLVCPTGSLQSRTRQPPQKAPWYPVPVCWREMGICHLVKVRTLFVVVFLGWYHHAHKIRDCISLVPISTRM